MHGAFLKQSLVNAGVDVRGLIEADDVFTTLAFVALQPSGEREFSFARKPGADTQLRSDEVDADMLEHTRVFHTGSLSLTQEPVRSATYEAIDRAKAAGAIISYDPNYRASLWSSKDEAIRYMRSLISTADIMKSLRRGAAAVDRRNGSWSWLTDVLLDQGVKLVAVTLGAKGAFIRVRQREPTGAGLSFQRD